MSLSIGFFGKLPAHGDFVQRNLCGIVVEHLDAWLQQGLAAVQQRLGAQWLDFYLTGPIWKFSLAPELLGDAAHIGAIMPSVDRVGRYFPLVVLITGANPNLKPMMAAEVYDAFLEDVSTDMIRTLDDPCPDADTFAQQIQSRVSALTLDAPLPPVPVEERLLHLEESEQLAIRKLNNTSLRVSLHVAADCLASRQYDQYSLWWTEGSARIPAQIRLCSGLPEDNDFVQFYSAIEK